MASSFFWAALALFLSVLARAFSLRASLCSTNNFFLRMDFSSYLPRFLRPRTADEVPCDDKALWPGINQRRAQRCRCRMPASAAMAWVGSVRAWLAAPQCGAGVRRHRGELVRHSRRAAPPPPPAPPPPAAPARADRRRPRVDRGAARPADLARADARGARAALGARAGREQAREPRRDTAVCPEELNLI